MRRSTKRLLHIALSAIAGAGCLLVSERISPTRYDALVTQADARVGRPLTPMSYAGVARRTTRRAVYGTAAAGAVAYGAYGAPGCAQVVNAYGQIAYRCP
jgi:hypothetical protein